MINKVSFTGREEMLIKVGEAAKQSGVEYVNEAKIYPKRVMDIKAKRIIQKNNEQIPYSSPFAPTGITPSKTMEFIPEGMPHKIDLKA